MNIEDLKRKVRALYRHARGTENPMEAMAFADKARELLQSYGGGVPEDYESASEEELCRKSTINSPQGATKFDTKKKDQMYSMLMSMTAEFYGCDVKVNREHVNDLTIFGPEAARETTILMYKYFLKACQDAGKKWHEDKPFFSVKTTTECIINGFSLRLAKLNGREIRDVNVKTKPMKKEVVEHKDWLPDTDKSDLVWLEARSGHWAITRAEAISLAPQLSTPKKKAVSGKKKAIGRPKKARH